MKKEIQAVLKWWEEAQYDTYGTPDGDEDNTYGTEEEQLFIDLKKAYESDPIPRKEVISIQPGDVIVVSSKATLTEAAHAELGDKMKHLFPDNNNVLLMNGDTMEVYREQGRYVDVTGIDGKREILDTKEVCDE